MQFPRFAQNRSLWLPLVFLALAILSVLYFILTKPKPVQQAQPEKAWLVSTLELQPGDHAPELFLFGRVESPRTTTLEAAIEADVEKTPVYEGLRVKQGDLLVELDNRDAKLLYSQRMAEVEELKAEIQTEETRYAADKAALAHEEAMIALAKKDVDRQVHLERTRAGSKSQLDDAREALRLRQLQHNRRELEVANFKHRMARLKAQLEKSKALAAQAQLDVERTQVHAPFAGRITQLFVSVGDRVQKGESLVRLFDLDNVEIRAQIPLRYLPLLRQAMQDPQQFNAWANVDGEKILLIIDRLAGQVGTGRAGVDALFRVSGDATRLELGRTLTLHVTLPEFNNVYAVPVDAVFGSDKVYRVVDDHLEAIIVERLGVIMNHGNVTSDKPGALPRDNELVIIRSDQLQSGDKIIITQLPNAITGLRVREYSNAVNEP